MLALESLIPLSPKNTSFYLLLYGGFDGSNRTKAWSANGILWFHLLAPNERGEERPVLNRGRMTDTWDDEGFHLEYTILYLLDEEYASDYYEDQDHLRVSHEQQIRSLIDIAKLYDPEGDFSVFFHEEYDRYFEDGFLPDDGSYLGLRLNRQINTKEELDTTLKLIETFVKKVEFQISEFACQPEDGSEEGEDDVQDDEEDIDDIALSFRDFIIISNRYSCIKKNHEMRKVTALLGFFRPGGKTDTQSLPAFHCTDCGEYYIHERDYLRAKGMDGTPRCKLVYEKDYGGERTGDYANLTERSTLNLCGYNVNRAAGLAEAQRRLILDFIIHDKVLELFRIKSHIAWLVKNNKRNPRNTEAVSKWEADLDYLNSEYFDDGTRIGVASIRTKRL